MHELALRIRTEVATKDKYTSIRPAGMVVFAATDWRKRRKWLEIVCDLVDPRPRPGKGSQPKREMFGPGFVREFGQARWDALCELWTPALRERWFTWSRGPEGAEKDLAMGVIWDEEVERISGFRATMGRDPTETADFLDTWLFSAHERRNLLILPNSDFSNQEAHSAEGQIEEVVNGRKVMRPTLYLDWEADLGLSQLERDRIRSRNYRADPRFDRAVAKTLFRPGSSHPEMGRF